jgi:hypothetical protein
MDPVRRAPPTGKVSIRSKLVVMVIPIPSHTDGWRALGHGLCGGGPGLLRLLCAVRAEAEDDGPRRDVVHKNRILVVAKVMRRRIRSLGLVGNVTLVSGHRAPEAIVRQASDIADDCGVCAARIPTVGMTPCGSFGSRVSARTFAKT